MSRQRRDLRRTACRLASITPPRRPARVGLREHLVPAPRDRLVATRWREGRRACDQLSCRQGRRRRSSSRRSLDLASTWKNSLTIRRAVIALLRFELVDLVVGARPLLVVDRRPSAAVVEHAAVPAAGRKARVAGARQARQKRASQWRSVVCRRSVRRRNGPRCAWVERRGELRQRGSALPAPSSPSKDDDRPLAMDDLPGLSARERSRSALALPACAGEQVAPPAIWLTSIGTEFRLNGYDNGRSISR